MAIVNLVMPKVGVRHELLFNKPASEVALLIKSLCLAPALGVTDLKVTQI
jgi:hypothetical protein